LFWLSVAIFCFFLDCYLINKLYFLPPFLLEELPDELPDELPEEDLREDELLLFELPRAEFPDFDDLLLDLDFEFSILIGF